MTHFLQRTALILLGTSALCASGAPAHAQLFKPNFPIRLPEAAMAATSPPPAQLAPVRQAALPRVAHRPGAVESQPLAPLEPAAADAPPQLILAATRRRANHSAAAQGPAATVVVSKGDTLGAIAARLGVSVAELKAANDLTRNTIHPGQVLKNPAAATRAKAERSQPKAAAGGSYTVVRGDTIFAIARRLGVTEEALRDANGLSAKGAIFAGQKLRLPGEAEPAAAEPSRRSEPSSARRQASSSRDEPPSRTEGRSATGRIVTVEGAAAKYTVRRGDNLAEIADRLNTTVTALKRDNRLKGSTIHPGQVLKGPRTSAKAYVAASGDTLDEVAKRFGVSARALRAENGLGRRAGIKAGQTLRLPAGYRDHGPVKTAAPEPVREPPRETAPPRPAPSELPAPRQEESPPPRDEPPPRLPSQPLPYRSTRPTPPLPVGTPPPVAPQAAAPLSDAQISAIGRGRFVWPLRGDILSEFGRKPGGQRNDGVNVQAEAGSAVRAAAAGEVVYAGDQVPGFGNLVLIKHADGWVTAYGHLSRVDVKMQQRVTQGQQIGEAGATGGVPEPQLHFEVRYAPSPLERARPIDPRLVLPR